MVNTEEIIERSFYMSLLVTALKHKFTLDPNEYLPVNKENSIRYDRDKKALSKFVTIFGVGSSQSRGAKLVPRITLELQGYYPGSVGMEKYQVDSENPEKPMLVEWDFSSKDVVIDVHLVANNQTDMRLLHNIMYDSLPANGYIKPYFNETSKEYLEKPMLPSGNIYIEVGNYYDSSDTDHGLLEKVYSYTVLDGLVKERVPFDGALTPIHDISILLDREDAKPDITLNIHS